MKILTVHISAGLEIYIMWWLKEPIAWQSFNQNLHFLLFIWVTTLAINQPEKMLSLLSGSLAAVSSSCFVYCSSRACQTIQGFCFTFLGFSIIKSLLIAWFTVTSCVLRLLKTHHCIVHMQSQREIDRRWKDVSPLNSRCWPWFISLILPSLRFIDLPSVRWLRIWFLNTFRPTSVQFNINIHSPLCLHTVLLSQCAYVSSVVHYL